MPKDLLGIKSHSHAERMAVVEQLVPLWIRKFGDNLLAIAISASVARGDDNLYSDLEMYVFIKQNLHPGEDGYLQRIVDGLLIEAIYYTPEEYLHEHLTLTPHWHLSASDRMFPVYNPALIHSLQAQVKKAQFSSNEFIEAATRVRYELQESFAKVLTAVEQKNVEGISLLLMDAVLHLLKMLALINQHSFTTFARYISEARRFQIKPDGFDLLLDLLVEGRYQDLLALRKIILQVFISLEEIFSQWGIDLFQDNLDPNLPNRPTLSPQTINADIGPGAEKRKNMQTAD